VSIDISGSTKSELWMTALHKKPIDSLGAAVQVNGWCLTVWTNLNRELQSGLFDFGNSCVLLLYFGGRRVLVLRIVIPGASVDIYGVFKSIRFPFVEGAIHGAKIDVWFSIQ